MLSVASFHKPVESGLAAAIAAALYPVGQSMLVTEFVLEPWLASELLDCSMPEQADHVLDETTPRSEDEDAGWDYFDMPIPYDYGDLPDVVLTHDGYLRHGRHVVERIVSNGKPERVQFYQCGDPKLYARDRERNIWRVADALYEAGEEWPLLKAAAWSGMHQASTLGRMAENEYERRQAVRPFGESGIDDGDFETIVNLLRDFPTSGPLETEIFAAALWGPVCSCPALAGAWAQLVHSALRGAYFAAPGPEDVVTRRPVFGNSVYWILKQSWYHFYAEHGVDELCMKCGDDVCPLLRQAS